MLTILCIVQTPVPSTEISITRPFSYLERNQAIAWQLIKEAQFKPEQLQGVDIVVFHRNCHPSAVPILNAVKGAGIPVIYELDDNFFDLPVELPIGRYMRNPYIVRTIETLLRAADWVKIGSPELRPLLSRHNQRLVYQPFAVDLSILDGLPPQANAILTIGYAGTIHHTVDFRLILNSIKRIAKEYPQVRWEFIGCLPEGLSDLPNFGHTPFIPSYAHFLQDLYKRNWRIGLGPLLDLPHNRCKTDNKLREYGACRIAGIYSNIPPYSANVRHRETGWLAENTEQAWYQALKTLLDDESLRAKIGEMARHWVEEERSIPVVAKLWMDLFQQTRKK